MLTVFRKDYVASPVTSARELGVSGNIGDDRLWRCGGMQVARMIWNTLHSRGVANVDILRIVRWIERNTEWMIEAGGEFLDLRGFAVRANATKDEDGSSAGIGEEKIAIGRGADEARHGECSPAQFHHFLVVRTLHGS